MDVNMNGILILAPINYHVFLTHLRCCTGTILVLRGTIERKIHIFHPTQDVFMKQITSFYKKITNFLLVKKKIILDGLNKLFKNKIYLKVKNVSRNAFSVKHRDWWYQRCDVRLRVPTC